MHIICYAGRNHYNNKVIVPAVFMKQLGTNNMVDAVFRKNMLAYTHH